MRAGRRRVRAGVLKGAFTFMENQARSTKDVINFSHFINSNFKHFPIRVLEGIRMYFGYNRIAYTILNRTPDGELYVSDIFGLSFPEERLNAYKEHYFRFDPFIGKVQRDLQKLDSTPQKYVWHTGEVSSDEEFQESKYCQHVLETGLRYQAVLSGRKYREFPTHVVSIFKSRQDGAFTEEELALLDLVGNVFVSALAHYLRQMDYDLKLTAWKHCGDMQKCGICVFTNLMPPDETPLFTAYKSLLFPRQTSRDILWKLTDGRDPMTALGHLPVSFYRTANGVTYHIQLQRDSAAISADKHVSNYIIMEITPMAPEKDGEDAAFRNSTALAQFSFTGRELDILELLQKGASNQQIANTLFMSIPTVKTHLGNIFKKLEVNSRGAAISKLTSVLYESGERFPLE